MAMTDGVIGGVMAGILSVTVLLIPMPGMVTGSPLASWAPVE